MITTEGLMIHALKRGILIADFNVLSVGMILEYINWYDWLYGGEQEEKNSTTKANQIQFDIF